MASRFVQRARKPNYTKEETETLLDQLIVYGHFLFNKTQPVNNQQKADVWTNIAMQVNSVPNSAGRTVDELKHRWQDMAQRARAVLRKNTSESPEDNSTTPSPKRPVPFLNKILQILGESHRDTNRRQEESLLASLDSTYSSDGSCANEAKQRVKEESDDQNTVVDLSQGNGSKTNSLKRSHSETLGYTSKSGVPPEMNKYNKYDITNPSSLPSFADDYSISTLHFDSKNQDQFENKRRRTSDSVTHGKSVSENEKNNSHFEGRRVRQHMETLRSMVLDPESQLVMEVEDLGPDEISRSTSRSASIVSTHDEDNHFEDNGLEDKAVSSILRQQLHQPPNLLVHPFMPTSNSNSNNIRDIPGTKPLSGQQPFRVASHYALPVYHNGTHPHSHLDVLPKPELQRQCLISQIRMQDQQTRYYTLKEKKLQLEIDILKGKCFCKNPSPADEGMTITPSSFPPHPMSISVPTSPCHISISNVTSCTTKDLEDKHKKISENETDTVSQGSTVPDLSQCKEGDTDFTNKVGDTDFTNEQNGKLENVEKERCGELETTHSPTNLDNEKNEDDEESLLVSFGDKGYEPRDANGEENGPGTEVKNGDWFVI